MLNRTIIFALLVFGSAIAAPEFNQNVVELLKPKLNSDRIEYFFGSYGVDPLDIASDSRIANLYSLDNGKKIMRTLAVVNFSDPMNSELQHVHREIVAGKSIGIALREDGWTIHKNPVYFGSVDLSSNLMEWMDEKDETTAAVHFYRLDVSKNDLDAMNYCTILEVHSPQYLSEEWLQALYSDQYGIESEEASQLKAKLTNLIQNFPSK